MRTLIRILLGVVIFGSLLALWASIYPGVDSVWEIAVATSPLSQVFIVLPVLAMAAAPLVLPDLMTEARTWAARPAAEWSLWAVAEAIAIPSVIVLTGVLLFAGAPRHAAFLWSRSALDAAAGDGPRSLDNRLGLYSVESRIRDPRGGTYFRLRSEPTEVDGIIYGLVKNPNKEGDPYGDFGYRLTPISADWYWFRSLSNGY